MIRYASGVAVAVLLLSNASSGWSQQQYLYTPSVVDAAGPATGKDGVLVQEVAVQKGDTLYGLSRKFSGHGSYFPQILLFNEIKDPNRIYPGNVFKIPVSKKHPSEQDAKAPVKNPKTVLPDASAPNTVPVPSLTTEIPLQDLKKADTGNDKKQTAAKKASPSVKKQVLLEKVHAAAASENSQKLFENAIKAYRQDDCKTALELFDRFLAGNQASPLAADASLYKAECYLKLSSQN